MLFVWGKFLPPCLLYGHHAFCMGDVSSAMLFVWENCSHACFSYGRRVFRHVFTMGEVSSTMLFLWETCSPLCFLYGKIGLLHGAHLAKCKHKPGSNWPRAPVGLMLGVCYGHHQNIIQNTYTQFPRQHLPVRPGCSRRGP